MKINGKELNLDKLNITFNTLCKLEDMGVEISSASKPMSMVRGFVALGLNESIDEAGADIEAYIEDGGDMQELVNPIAKAFEKSGFFQALNKQKPKLVVAEAQGKAD